MSGSDVAAVVAAPAGQDVRKRWLLLAAALVMGLVAAFAIGSAVKKTSAPAAAPGTLAQPNAAGSQHASITPLTNAGAVPALHAPPKKPKAKTTTTSNTTPNSSSVSSSSVSSSPSVSSSSPVHSSTPAQTTPVANNGGGGGSTGSTGGGSTSSGGVSHGGGGG